MEEELRRRVETPGPGQSRKSRLLEGFDQATGRAPQTISCRARLIIALALRAACVVTLRRLSLLPSRRRFPSNDGWIGCITACSPTAHGRDMRCDVRPAGFVVETRDGTGVMSGHGVHHLLLSLLIITMYTQHYGRGNGLGMT